MRKLLFILCLAASPVFAVQPDEILPDAALEARARDLSQGLRCLVCRNENIDDSHADLARDLRLLVRERLVAGDSDAQTLDYIVARYGEYVLLDPTGRGANMLLWWAGPLMLLGGGGAAFAYLRRRKAHPESPAQALNPDEAARLAEILKK